MWGLESCVATLNDEVTRMKCDHYVLMWSLCAYVVIICLPSLQCLDGLHTDVPETECIQKCVSTNKRQIPK